MNIDFISTGLLTAISTIIDGLAQINEKTGLVSAVLTSLGVILAAITVKFVAATVATWAQSSAILALRAAAGDVGGALIASAVIAGIAVMGGTLLSNALDTNGATQDDDTALPKVDLAEANDRTNYYRS